MKSEIKKLARLVAVHNKIVTWHLESIAAYEVSIADCDKQREKTLVSMTQMEGLGLGKGPNFTRILREIQDRRARLVQAAQAAKAEHARISAIVDRLIERKSGVEEEVDQTELEESIDEWSNVQSSFS